MSFTNQDMISLFLLVGPLSLDSLPLGKSLTFPKSTFHVTLLFASQAAAGCLQGRDMNINQSRLRLNAYFRLGKSTSVTFLLLTRLVQ